MTVQRVADFPLTELLNTLTSRGWECSLSETLTAYRDDGDDRLRLVADRSGRLLLRRIVQRGKPEERVVDEAQRTYMALRESFVVSAVMTTIATPGDFEAALSTMMSLASDEPPEAAEVGEEHV